VRQWAVGGWPRVQIPRPAASVAEHVSSLVSRLLQRSRFPFVEMVMRGVVNVENVDGRERERSDGRR
jgi:hypothetical protein